MNRLPRVLLAATLIFGLSACGPSLAKRKDQADIHYRLGEVHLRDRNLADALKELTKAIELYPDNAGYHNALGLAYFMKGMYPEAHKSYDRAVSIDPKLSDAYLNKSALYITERKWDGAIKSAQEATKNIFYRTPEYAYYNIGVAYYNKEDYASSIDNLRRAVKANYNYAPAHYQMGIVLEKTDKLKEAVESYKAAVVVSPSYLDAYFSLGMALAKSKDKAGAQKAFEKVIEIAPASDKGQSAREYIKLIK